MTSDSDMVFVVMGTTGEYSDRSEWPVRAFLTETEAQAWADGAKTRFLELCGGEDPGCVDYMKRGKLAAKNQYDPGHGWDYTGVDWFIYRVPLAPANSIDKS